MVLEKKRKKFNKWSKLVSDWRSKMQRKFSNFYIYKLKLTNEPNIADISSYNHKKSKTNVCVCVKIRQNIIHYFIMINEQYALE